MFASHGRWSKNIIGCEIYMLLRWDTLCEANSFTAAAAAVLLALYSLRYLPPYVRYLESSDVMSFTKLQRIFDEGTKSHSEVARTELEGSHMQIACLPGQA